MIGAACAEDCRTAMRLRSWLRNTSSIGFLIPPAAAAMSGNQTNSFQTALVLLAAFIATFLWSAYPPNVAMSVITPSVSGLRLPLATLATALILTAERQPDRHPPAGIHFLWMLGVAWSPESAFYVTFVWWPYYIWRCCLARPDHQGIIRAGLMAAGLLLTWLVVLLALFFTAYHFIYGVRQPCG
ncbi:hypothetical protein ACU4GD_15865 [Cupriavidus basilensis]